MLLNTFPRLLLTQSPLKLLRFSLFPLVGIGVKSWLQVLGTAWAHWRSTMYSSWSQAVFDERKLCVTGWLKWFRLSLNDYTSWPIPALSPIIWVNWLLGKISHHDPIHPVPLVALANTEDSYPLSLFLLFSCCPSYHSYLPFYLFHVILFSPSLDFPAFLFSCFFFFSLCLSDVLWVCRKVVWKMHAEMLALFCR